jgi:hypothetical protein
LPGIVANTSPVNRSIAGRFTRGSTGCIRLDAGEARRPIALTVDARARRALAEPTPVRAPLGRISTDALTRRELSQLTS